MDSMRKETPVSDHSAPSIAEEQLRTQTGMSEGELHREVIHRWLGIAGMQHADGLPRKTIAR